MLDPISKQPEIKFCAVNIIPVRDFPEAVFATISFETPTQEVRSTFEVPAAIEEATPQPPASAK